MTKVKQRRVITTMVAVPAPVPTPSARRSTPVEGRARDKVGTSAAPSPGASSRPARASVTPPKATAPVRKPTAAATRGTPARSAPASKPRRAASARTSSAAGRDGGVPSVAAATATRRAAAVVRTPTTTATPKPVRPPVTAVKPAPKPPKLAAKPPKLAAKPPKQAAKAVTKMPASGRSSAPVRGITGTTIAATAHRLAAKRPTGAPARKAAPTKGGRRGATARGKRPVPPKAPLPREIFIKALDPLRKCGPNTSVLHMFRVDESIGGAHAATHLVFYDRHGWYCVHGRTCQAVEDVRKHGGVKQVGLDYNGRMRA